MLACYSGVCLCVQDRGRLWWRQCVSVCVGQSVCVTALRVCVLHGWRGNSVLCVTDRSTLHTHTQEHAHTPGDGEDTHTAVEDTHTDTQSDLSLSLRHNDPEEAEPETDVVQSAVRMKQSKVISYQVGFRECCPLIGCNNNNNNVFISTGLCCGPAPLL